MTDHPYDVLALPDGINLIFTPCPGTQEASIADALQTLKSAGAEAMITLLHDTELHALSVESLSAEAEKADISWYQLPIEDDAEPSLAFEQAWNTHKTALFDLVKQNQTVAIHCRGGSGRTGLMAAVLLLELGMDWAEVKQQIQSIRPKALSHPAHVAYLNKHLAL
jgi:protein-tyrosine phosphatase